MTLYTTVLVEKLLAKAKKDKRKGSYLAYEKWKREADSLGLPLEVRDTVIQKLVKILRV